MLLGFENSASTPLKHCLLHQVHDASVESSALSVKSWISSFLMIIMIIMIIIFSYPPQIIHMRDQLHILWVVKNISPTLEKYFCRKYLQATVFSPDAGLTSRPIRHNKIAKIRKGAT